MKEGKAIKTLVVVIFLILSLVLISCRSNGISQISSESEDVIIEADETLESEAGVEAIKQVNKFAKKQARAKTKAKTVKPQIDDTPTFEH